MTPSYERIAENLLSKQVQKPGPFIVFDEKTGKLLRGTKSLHRTPVSRVWRTFWRIKSTHN